jgi:hypothetical protein
VLMVYAKQQVYKAIIKKLKGCQSVETDEGVPDATFTQTKNYKGHKASECKKKRENEETVERESVETDEGGPNLLFVQKKKINMIKKGLCFQCGEKGHKAWEC